MWEHYLLKMRERISSLGVHSMLPHQFQLYIEHYAPLLTRHSHLRTLWGDFRIFQPLRILAYWIYSGKADTKNGWLAKPTLNPNLLRTCSTALVMFWFWCWCPPILFWILFRTLSAICPHRTIRMLASGLSVFSKFRRFGMCASLGSYGFSSRLITSAMRPTCLTNCLNRALVFKIVAICYVSKLAKSWWLSSIYWWKATRDSSVFAGDPTIWLRDMVGNIGPMSCCRVVVGGLVEIILPIIPKFISATLVPIVWE